nr:hypothetical protein [Tanacetum cinerariifolium]
MTKLPPTSSSLSVSSVITPVKESPSIAHVTTLPPPSISTKPYVLQQTTTPTIIDALTVTTVISESDALSAIDHRKEKRSRHENMPFPRFTKYSAGQIRPKKSIGKGSQGKKTVDDSQETVDGSEESEPEHEPELVKR